jgi:hypothetical protein
VTGIGHDYPAATDAVYSGNGASSDCTLPGNSGTDRSRGRALVRIRVTVNGRSESPDQGLGSRSWHDYNHKRKGQRTCCAAG